MTLILGIDPGSKTTGWCLYDTQNFVRSCGEFQQQEVSDECCMARSTAETVVIEKPVGQGPTRPDMVETGIVAGRLFERWKMPSANWITRLEVRKTLSDVLHGTIQVRNDASVWAALVAYFGHDSDRKPKRKKGVVIDQGGPLGEVKGHARAALAVALAFHLMQQAKEEHPLRTTPHPVDLLDALQDTVHVELGRRIKSDPIKKAKEGP